MVEKRKVREKFAEEEAQGYRFTIYGKNVQVTEGMKNYLKEKLAKIESFRGHLMDVHAYLDIQRLEHTIMIMVKFEHFQIKVSAASSDMYASIDEAVHRLQQKIKKWKGRIEDHVAKHLSAVDMVVNVYRRPQNFLEEINADIEMENKKKEKEARSSPKIIGIEKMALKTLTTDEAVMKMELSDDPFLLFHGEEDHKLKVIYRREDGNYGIVQPESKKPA